MDRIREELISVIIPVYGVEKYLSKCLESVINQTYKNIEIILVNDGSLDRSGEICKDYAYRDNRIKLIDKMNGGLSDARNCGLKNAMGRYITFVDSDDYLEIDYIEYLYNLIKSGPYKMSMTSIFNDYTDTSKVIDNGDGSIFDITGKKAIEMMCYHDLIDTCAYAKLFDADIMEGFSFPKGKVYEDIGSLYLLFDKCPLIKCGMVSKYHYVIRKGSITTGVFNNAKLDLLEMTDSMAEYINKKYPELKKATLRRQVYARFSTINQMLDVTNESDLATRKELIEYVKRNSRAVLVDSKIPFRDKMAILMIKINFDFYKFIWNIYLPLHRRNII